MERKARLALNDSSGKSHRLMVNRDIGQEAYKTVTGLLEWATLLWRLESHLIGYLNAWAAPG